MECPKVVKETNRNPQRPLFAELRADADYYSDMWDMGGFDKWFFGLARSAKATIKRQWNGGIERTQ